MQSPWLSRNGISKAALHSAARTVAMTVLLLYGSAAQASERESTAGSLLTGSSSDESALVSIAGDVNGDGLVDLKDAVIGLQVCAGITPTDALYLSGDVNGDGIVGVPEAVFGLQMVSGLRP